MRGIPLILAATVALATPVLAAADAPGQDGSTSVAETKPLKPSQARAEKLDALFARLYLSHGGASSQAIEKEIWSLWSTSDSPTAEALLQQATMAMNEGSMREALYVLNSLIGSYPDFAEAWNKRATLYYLMGRDNESLLDIQRVLDLEPRHFGALAGRGLIYQRQKKYSAAMEAFRQALKINPGMDQIKEALKELEKLEQGI